MDNRNFGKIRVGIDWQGKGRVDFDKIETDPVNILSPFIYTDLYLWETVGSSNPFPHLAPDQPLPFVLSGSDSIYSGLNPYGSEYVTSIIADAHSTFMIGRDDVGNYRIQVLPSTEYTAWVWVSSSIPYSNDGSHLLEIQLTEYIGTTATITASTNVQYDLAGGNLVEAVEIHFTTNASTDAITFWFNKLDSGDIIDFNVMGLSLYENNITTEPKYTSAGFSFMEDEITDYVMQVQGAIGKTNWETILFDEGTLTLTLNNDDLRFSPENSSGPYYGFIKPYNRVWVLISDENDLWTMLWSGWTHQFKIETGLYNSRQATITCRQGLFNLEAQDPTLLVADDGDLSYNYIADLFSKGYEIATGSTRAIGNEKVILQAFQGGVEIDLLGANFVENVNRSYTQTLQNIAELNGNYLWLSRYGRVIFNTFANVKSLDGDELPYDLTTYMSYTYSPIDLYKSIIANYNVWVHNDADVGAIEMQGQDQIIYHGATDFPFDIKPRYNGFPLIGGVVLDVSAFLPVDYTDSPSSGTANAAFTEIDEGIYTRFTGLANNTTDIDYRLSLISRDSSDVWYVTDTNQQEVQDGTEPKALESLVYNNPLITNGGMASDFVTMQVARRTNVVSWFDQASLANKSADAVAFITHHSVGDVIHSSEEQMGNVTKHMIIIGESFIYVPGYLQFLYNLAPTSHDTIICPDDCVASGDTSGPLGSNDHSFVGSYSVVVAPTSDCTITGYRIFWGDDTTTDHMGAGTFTEYHTFSGAGDFLVGGAVLTEECGQIPGLGGGSITVS